MLYYRLTLVRDPKQKVSNGVGVFHNEPFSAFGNTVEFLTGRVGNWAYSSPVNLTIILKRDFGIMYLCVISIAKRKVNGKRGPERV